MVENKVDEIETLLAEIQFDRWVFGFPTKFTVVSHGHVDHDPIRHINGLEFDFPEPLIFGERYANAWVRHQEFARKRVEGPVRFPAHYPLRDGVSVRVKGVKITCLGPNTVAKYVGIQGKVQLHADWWLLATRKLLVLFVGELNLPEIPLLDRLLHSPQIDAVLLPSYGKIEPPKHGVSKPEELAEAVKNLALQLKARGKSVYALPHPVTPDWALKSAIRKGRSWKDVRKAL